MNSKALEILKKITKPMSEHEVQQFLEARHGNIGGAKANGALDESVRRPRSAMPSSSSKRKPKPRAS